MKAMYKVLNAATKIKDFESAIINNCQLELKGETYQIHDLEKLLHQIRPPTLSTKKSENTLAFFGHYTFLSNHHPSPFKIGDTTFKTMEQYLAYSRATISGKASIINKALKSEDPIHAKYILHSLRENQVEVWEDNVPSITLEGLRAKFDQNPTLRDKLLQTYPLTLGEASTNPRWGIGLELHDPEVLNHEKWTASANLLGRSLRENRQELHTKLRRATD